MRNPELYKSLEYSRALQQTRKPFDRIREMWGVGVNQVHTAIPESPQGHADEYSVAVLMTNDRHIAEMLLGRDEARRFRDLLQSAVRSYNTQTDGSNDPQRQAMQSLLESWHERGL